MKPPLRFLTLQSRSVFKLAIVSLEAVDPLGQLGISSGSLSALGRLHRSGLALAFTSNRELGYVHSLHAKFPSLKQFPLVAYGGSLVLGPEGQVWSREGIHLSLVPVLLSIIRQPGVSYLYHTAGGEVISPVRTSAVRAWEERFGRVSLVAKESGRDALRQQLADDLGPLQVDLLGDDREVREVFGRLGRGLLKGLKTRLVTDTWLQIRAQDLDKERGCQALLLQLGIEWSEVVAFGRDDSDLSTLVAARLGVALADASPALRAAAQHPEVTGDTGDYFVEAAQFAMKKMSG